MIRSWRVRGMFRILSLETRAHIPYPVAIVLAALLLAFALNVLAAFRSSRSTGYWGNGSVVLAP